MTTHHPSEEHSLTPCVICEQAPTQEPLSFCQNHRRHYHTRQWEGVTTAALDPRWGDTLANWRERPESLQTEANAADFRLSTRRGGWFLFKRVSEAGLAYWTVVHAQTNTIRLFAGKQEEEVWEELMGPELPPASPAPEPPAVQSTTEARQAVDRLVIPSASPLPKPPPERPAKPEPFFLPERDRYDIAKLVKHAKMPICGIVGNPLGLRLVKCGISWWGRKINIISFTFRSNPNFEVELTSNGWYVSRDPYTTDKSSELLRQSLRVGKVLMTGEIVWMASKGRCHLSLEAEGWTLNGHTLGLEREDALRILDRVVAINDRPDLIAQYTAEIVPLKDGDRGSDWGKYAPNQ